MQPRHERPPAAAAQRRSALGILAGGGGLPAEIAEAVTGAGRAVHIVALDGEADRAIERFAHTWVNWGGVGAMLEAFARHGCREIVIVGRVRRPNLLKVRPDLGFWRSLPRLLRFLKGGDDAILRMVVAFFESHGLEVRGAHDVAPRLLAEEGAIAGQPPGAEERAAILTAARAIAALGPFDAAQAAVAVGPQLLALEGADGTDAMLQRLPPPPGGRRGVLVKLPKPGQEMRIDLPAIGPETVRRAAAAGLAGIGVRAGATLIAERDLLRRLALETGLFVQGLGAADLAPAATARAPSAAPAPDARSSLVALTARAPAAGAVADAGAGALLLAALAPFWPEASCIVARGYVLAVEGPGEARAAAERAGRLKPWGARLLRRRSGVLVVTCAPRPDEVAALVAAAAASGLAGIAAGAGDRAALAGLAAAAAPAGLFVAALGEVA